MLDFIRTCQSNPRVQELKLNRELDLEAEDTVHKAADEGQRGFVQPQIRNRIHCASLSKPAINSSYLKMYSVTCMSSVILQTSR